MRQSSFCLILQIFSSLLGAKIAEITFEDASYPDNCFFDATGRLFKSYYECYQHQPHSTKEYLIPKMIHFVWLGREAPPSVNTAVNAWKKWHPEWPVKIWTDHDVTTCELPNQKAFAHAINFGEKSDIFRYEVLYRYGDMYADIDFECLHAFYERHQSCEFYAGIVCCNSLLNGLFGAKPRDRILKACIDNLPIGKADHDHWRITEQTGPSHFSRMVLAHINSYPSGKIILLPSTFFYPLPGEFKKLKHALAK